MFHDPIRPPSDPDTREHRFFFALLPPTVLARQLANAADWFRDTGRAVAADRLHITLFILPDLAEYPANLIERLRSVGAAVASPPTDILLDYVSGGGRSIALRPRHRIAGLAALHREIAARCRAAGIDGRPGYAFQPHITLGYRDGRPFGERVTPVGWTAAEFVLIHSHLGRTKHTVVGRWRLIAGAPEQGLLF